MRRFVLALFIGATISTSAQKVGLVLSGGGAKGITHIGLIKALEENNIPIDYITGTSMGAIVGSLYSMGMSVEEMANLLKSEDFSQWSSGEIPPELRYNYHNATPKPTIVELPFSLNGKRIDSLQIKARFLPTNLVPPHQMNYAFVPLYAQATAAAGGDFDKLFVPFRCVASDVYKKEAVIFRKGQLGDAVRASMTFPFVYKPLTIDGRLLFDGGIFNNFPVDVMQNDFKPGFIIGSVVSENPDKPTESDPFSQVMVMIMNKTNYSIAKNEGFLFNFKLDDVDMFDFTPVDKLIKMGYDSAMVHMDEIKAMIKSRRTASEVAVNRKAFTEKYPALVFQKVNVQGVDTLKKKYIEKVFHKSNSSFTIKDMKEAYFKLISDDKILEVIPHAIYNQKEENFELTLNVKTQDKLLFLLGGNVSSSTSNQVFFGIQYHNLSNYAQMAHFDAQFGRIYNGISGGFRIDPASQHDWYLQTGFVVHKFDYFEDDQVFYNDMRLSSYNQFETYAKISVGVPVSARGRFETGLGYGIMNDRYAQNNASINLASELDKSSFQMGSLFLRIDGNNLTHKMYPVSGYNYCVVAQLLLSREKFSSPLNAASNTDYEGSSWVHFRALYDRYVPLEKSLRLGISAEMVYSTRKMLNNYTISVIQAPAYSPTLHSKSLANPAFKANQYAAIGIKPIFMLTKQLQLRSENYCFLPYKTIEKGTENQGYYSEPFKTIRFINEASLVFDFKIASAAIFANHYSAGPNRWNFGVNLGVLLFNKKFLE